MHAGYNQGACGAWCLFALFAERVLVAGEEGAVGMLRWGVCASVIVFDLLRKFIVLFFHIQQNAFEMFKTFPCNHA